MIRTTLSLIVLLVTPLLLAGCSTNAATGKQQFTALMSPAQENQIGASEHQKIAAQFGFYENPTVTAYVNEIGRKVSANTENPDVKYKFYVLDSPIVNAFALPGGYIYFSRGLLALANSEAEVAAVMAHEVGHITGRHSAERYSRSAVTALGANILSIALDNGAASQALGLGANLYLSSYSRSQENESDTLGLRYMTRAGYHPEAMASFLSSLHAQSALDSKIDGKKNQGTSYFSTHPATGERVNKTHTEAKQYPNIGTVNRDHHMSMINGLTYGDSVKQGFTRGQKFYHPEIGFAFEAPAGYKIINQPSQVVAQSERDKAAMVFDMAANKGKLDAVTYLNQIWMKGENIQTTQPITINGMKAATATFSGHVNGRRADIRLIAIEFKPDSIARFQIAIPKDASATTVENLKRASYSFRKLTQQERRTLKPQRIKIVTARAGDSVAGMANKMAYDDLKLERFRTLNALVPGEELKAGQTYKIVVY